MKANTQILVIKCLLAFCLCLPLLVLAYWIYFDIQMPGVALGADPGETVVLYLGEWAIRILLAAFSVSPVRRLLQEYPATRPTAQALARSRRMVGLFAFTYAFLHFVAYVAFFLQFEVAGLVEEFVERTYITLGLVALLGLAAMAFTSTKGWRRRMGPRWQTLHKFVYLAVALSIAHLFWLTRDGYGEVFLYSVWFVVLLWLRAPTLNFRKA